MHHRSLVFMKASLTILRPHFLPERTEPLNDSFSPLPGNGNGQGTGLSQLLTLTTVIDISSAQ